jgi:N-acetylneuraminic acid mutarotase
MHKRYLLIFCFFIYYLSLYPQNAQWITKASNPFTTGVAAAVSFSINGKGYVCSGAIGPTETRSLWEYDTLTDTWTAKTSIPGLARDRAFGFSIGNKGYLGTGLSSGNQLQDFWEYTPSTNSWLQLPDFPGGPCMEATGFSSLTKGYAVVGIALWEFDPSNNTWTAKSPFPGQPRSRAIGFIIADKAYYGMGNPGTTFSDELWEYDITNDSWSQKLSMPSIQFSNRDFPVAFAIGNNGYVGTGRSLAGSVDFWQYKPSTDSWYPMPDVPGFTRFAGIGFSIGSVGYAGYGASSSTPLNDFHEFIPDTSTTGILNSNNKNEIVIFPNPSNEYFYLQLAQEVKVKFELNDLSGKSLRLGTTEAIQTKVDVSDIAPGVYFLKLISNSSKTIYLKIILN